MNVFSSSAKHNGSINNPNPGSSCHCNGIDSVPFLKLDLHKMATCRLRRSQFFTKDWWSLCVAILCEYREVLCIGTLIVSLFYTCFIKDKVMQIYPMRSICLCNFFFLLNIFRCQKSRISLGSVKARQCSMYFFFY